MKNKEVQFEIFQGVRVSSKIPSSYAKRINIGPKNVNCKIRREYSSEDSNKTLKKTNGYYT